MMPIPDAAPRALYCTDTYPPQVNGVSVVTALSVQGLRSRGWEVEVIAPRYPDGQFNPFDRNGMSGQDEGWTTAVPSIPMPLYPDLRLAAPPAVKVGAVLERFRPDIVHVATEFMIGRTGQRLALQQGLPVVSSYHTDFSRYTASYGLPWLRRPVSQYLGRFHRRSRRVYTPGHPAREELHRLGVMDAEVWGRGVDISTFHPGHRDAALRRVYAADDALLFLHVGRLAPEKGVERIIEAFCAARLEVGSLHPMHLVIAGAGPREPALRRMADQHITFLGNLDRARILPRLYASADAFLFASETETLGLVILEAMASGLPVIAAPAGGVADHLADGSNGLAFTAGEVGEMTAAIIRLAQSPRLRRQLAHGARHTAEALSWERELDRLDCSYREVLDLARHRASA